MPRERLLLIDDDVNLLGSWSVSFNRAGFEVNTAAGASDGISMFSTKKPDLVILDYMMPGMNGIEVLKRLHRIDARVPKLMISGTSDVQVAVTALKTEAFDFLSKPIGFETLLAAVKKAIGRVQQSSRASSRKGSVNVTILEDSPPISLLHINVALDEFNKAEIEKEILAIMSDGLIEEGLILSLQNVPYINNVGLNFYIEFFSELKKKNINLVIGSMSETVINYLNLLGYLDYFPFEENVDDALRLLKQKMK